MNDTKTSITYSGKALEGGMMEVRDFAPSIQAFAEICQDSFTALTGSEEEISVAINSDFKKGSFEVVLALAVESVTDTGLRLAIDCSARHLLNTILKMFAIYKETKGRPVKHIEQNGKSFIYESEEDKKIAVGFEEGKLVASHSSRKKFKKFVLPLSNEGADEISFKNEKLKIAKPDIEFIDDSADDENDQFIQEMLVEVITPQLDGRRKWRFSLGGRDHFSADVEDENFLSKVKKGEIDFRSGDRLRVKRQTSQSIEQDKLKANHTIAEVISTIRQGDLLDDEEE